MKNSNTTVSWFEDIRTEVNEVNSDIEAFAQCISQSKVDNNIKIINLLKSIDFMNSGLSQEVLNKRQDPNQWCGDLQFSTEFLIHYLENDTGHDDIDMSDIDRSLYLIAKMFEGAVIHGETETAFAAQAGLMNGVLNIRNKFFSLDDKVRESYMQTCKKYLESCYLCVSVKNIIDKSNKNLRLKQKNLAAEFARLEESKHKMALMIKQSPQLAEQINEVWSQTYIQSHFMWRPEMIELYKMLVELRIARSGLIFKGYMLETEEKRIFFYREIADRLEDIVRTIPVPEDPEILSKLQEMMEGSLSKAEKIDSDFDTLGNMMEDFDKRLQNIGKTKQQSKMLESTLSDIEKNKAEK